MAEVFGVFCLRGEWSPPVLTVTGSQFYGFPSVQKELLSRPPAWSP